MDPGNRLFYRVIRAIAWLICKTLFRHRVEGHELLPRSGPFLLAVNHASNLDPVLAGISMHRPLAFMARSSLFKPAPIGWFLSQLNALPLEREGVGIAGFRAVKAHLDGGGAALVFPEGTRSADGKLRRFKGGIVRLAKMAQVPVVPAYISGSSRAFGRGKWLPRPYRTQISFGECIDKEVFSEEDNGLEVLRRAMVELIPEGEPSPEE
ncbi:MAG: hypothetical protein CBC13_05275 [Planctomycetia bacterium TMED53]|nr:MAG: hypothetical protein CBC13_05275 [Planctomycetia bacterium TMED53]